jgi:hypothetical protein
VRAPPLLPLAEQIQDTDDGDEEDDPAKEKEIGRHHSSLPAKAMAQPISTIQAASPAAIASVSTSTDRRRRLNLSIV